VFVFFLFSVGFLCYCLFRLLAIAKWTESGWGGGGWLVLLVGCLSWGGRPEAFPSFVLCVAGVLVGTGFVLRGA